MCAATMPPIELPIHPDDKPPRDATRWKTPMGETPFDEYQKACDNLMSKRTFLP